MADFTYHLIKKKHDLIKYRDYKYRTYLISKLTDEWFQKSKDEMNLWVKFNKK